jgi:membrane protein YdbS with pleckstrin-like domain
MSRSDREAAEALAQQRLIILSALRFSGIALVMLGFAIVRKVIDLPWAVGAVLAVVGVLEFFFLPRFIARRWNAGDDQRR